MKTKPSFQTHWEKRLSGLTSIKLFLMLLLAGLSLSANAHPLSPAMLEMTQLSDQRYQVQWRLSARQATRIAPSPELPEACSAESTVSTQREPGGLTLSSWKITCESPSLVGETIHILGLEDSPINVIIKINFLDGTGIQALLDAGNTAYVIAEPEQFSDVFWRYTWLGVEHLILGPDHLLFVLGLILLVRSLRQLIWTLTAFTLGHSITLSLAALGLLQVNTALMELTIAITLVITALLLVKRQTNAPDPFLSRHPGLMATGFGLIHGLGFAGALNQIGLPQDAVLTALLAFNIGIELAQIAVACFALVLAKFLVHVIARIRMRPNLELAGSFRMTSAYVIGPLAVLWCIERMQTLTGIYLSF